MLRHLPPIAYVLVLLLVARQIYPYSSFNTPTVDDGFEIEVVATDLGGPTCLEWLDASTLVVCDRDGGQIYTLDMNMSKTVLINNLDRPHDVAITNSDIFVSEAGKLSRYAHNGDLGDIGNKTVLISGVPTGNHQTNAVNILPNGTLVWHSGSTCNICVEDDERNGALLWVNGSTGDHGILASGVRNSSTVYGCRTLDMFSPTMGAIGRGTILTKNSICYRKEAIMDRHTMPPPILFLQEALHQSQPGPRTLP